MPSASINGVELHYTMHGDGPPVYVMHGGLGLDHTYFRPWLDALGERATLVFYDHRGNGRSSRAPLDAVDDETWVSDAEALRRHLGHERIIVLGHSYGSFLAQQYALCHPQRLDGLILSNSAPAFDYQPVLLANAAARATPDELAALHAGLSAPAADDESLARLCQAILPVYFHRPDRELIARAFADVRYAAEAFNASMFRCAPRFNTLARLHELAVPTLILSGADDWITPVAEGGARLAAGIRASEHVVFEHSGHYPFIEERERYVAVVGAWLAARRGKGQTQ